MEPEQQELPTTKEEVSLAGEYEWNAEASGPMVDFETLDLKADGTYEAKVAAKLVNSEVRSFRAPCTLPEGGLWTMFKVSGQSRLRVSPSTGPARVYGVSLDAAGALELSRRGGETTLFPL